MDLILIACCNSKTSGGSPVYRSSSIGSFLSEKRYFQLFRSRQDLAKLLNIKPGPDLGDDKYQDLILFKPAYLRYAGHVYTRSEFGVLYPQSQDKNVVIVSALYGILTASDSIRNYQANMQQRIGENRLYTWWKQHGLGEILEEYILNFHPTRVYDLLSNDYFKALEPWPPQSFYAAGIRYERFEYLGEGSGSQWHRGDDLKNLLHTHS